MTAVHNIITQLLNREDPRFTKQEIQQKEIQQKEIQQAARELGLLDHEQFKDLPITTNGRQVTQTKSIPNYHTTVETNEKKSSVLIRVDDLNHHEFWLEIEIPLIKVLHLLK